MSDIEIITHCYRYARLLAYQLSSLILHPPACSVEVTVCCTGDRTVDPFTLDYVNWYSAAAAELGCSGLSIRPYLMEPARLFRRAIGRNEVAKASAARVVWFADCDQPWGDGALDWLASRWNNGIVLAFPRIVGKCPHEYGDGLIAKVDQPGLYDIDPVAFIPTRYRAAIGGMQIVSGETARRGYLPEHRRYHRPAAQWMRTKEDPVYRRWLKGGRGTPLKMPACFRIRHSQYGRSHVGVFN